MKERLQKILSAHGIASRREAEVLIKDGRVSINGVTAALGQSADPGTDIIAVDGVEIPPVSQHVYIMLNKPLGYVTTMRDEQGRKTVIDLLDEVPVRVHPVGRLDINSEGLLILTNDGEFTNKLTHPSNEKEKTYRVTVEGDVRSAIAPLSEPMCIDGYQIKPAKVKVINVHESGGTLEITVHEGRNRQIRKMCTQVSLEVSKLERVSVGGLSLGSLKRGKWRYLTSDEIASLYE